MTGRVARVLAFMVSFAVLAVSGTYMLVYLGRWEWNRAIVAGLVFLAILVVISTAMILRRLADIAESCAARPVQRAPDVDVADALRSANAEAATERFEWLRPDPGQTSVFVPVLLGAGVILSALAYAIERASGAIAGATLDRRTASILPLDLPLTTGRPVAAPPRATGQRGGGGRRRTRLGAIAAVLVVLFLGGLGAETIRRVTQTIPGELSGPGTSSLTIEVRTKGARSPEELVAALWTVCGARIPGEPEITSVGTDGDQVRISVDRALGVTGSKRIVGCLEDLTIDRVLADVIDLEVVRQPSGP